MANAFNDLMIKNQNGQFVGNFFVYGGTGKRSDYLTQSPVDGFYRKVKRYKPLYSSEWKDAKSLDTDSQAYVLIWAYTPGDDNSNWGCHYSMPILKEDDPWSQLFPVVFPMGMIKDLKEGQSIVLDTVWGEVLLSARQCYSRVDKLFQDAIAERI